MKTSTTTLAAAAALSLGMLSAIAQTSPGTSSEPMVQQAGSGIVYISGGAGEEDRASMAARQADFPFRVVLSAAGGAYVVADTLVVRNAQGDLVTVRDAGPIVMLNLPPGTYTLEATWQGRTEQREVRVASAAQTLNWQFPG